MSVPGSDDPLLDRSLLNKADALIRRNRPDGVGSDADELPLLTDALDDELPELTDALDELVAADTHTASPRPASLNIDLDAYTPTGQFQTLSPLPPEEVIEKAVDAAVERTRREMLAEHSRVLAGHARALAEAEARARSEAFHESRAQQQRAIQAAIAQGREEAEINQWASLQEARRESAQSIASAMSERLIALDAHIAHSINDWLAKELPGLIATELLGVSERLRVQTTAHLRATLLPEVSEQISKVLDSALEEDSNKN